MADDEVTVDTLLRGRVRLHQPARGARVSVDPLLLAAFVAPPYGRFLDVGCGTGALSFVLLASDPTAAGVAIELQPRLAALARRGRDDNGWQARLDVVTADVRAAAVGAAAFDLVATNPPYRPVADGNVSPDEQRALAHHELALSLGQCLDAAARAVRPGGRVAVVLPASRALELGAELRARDLGPARLRAVHPYADRPASRVLVEAERGGRRALVIEPPLVLHASDGGFTIEAQRMLDG